MVKFLVYSLQSNLKRIAQWVLSGNFFAIQLIFLKKSARPFLLKSCYWLQWSFTVKIWDAWRDFVPLVQFKICKKQPWRSFSSCRLLKVIPFHECFSRFSNCTNGTKLRRSSHMSQFHVDVLFLYVWPIHVTQMWLFLFEETHYLYQHLFFLFFDDKSGWEEFTSNEMDLRDMLSLHCTKNKIFY